MNAELSSGIDKNEELSNANALVSLNKMFTVPERLAGRYEYLQHIGSGTQGDVFKARDLSTGKLVAIKQLRIDQVENWKAYDLFEREANLLSKLDISGIAKFYEAVKCFEDDPPCACIVQEFIDGVSLESSIRSGHRMTIAEVFDVARQILNILEKLHHSDPPVIHRDLKPNNIMISHSDGKNHVYLIDFGAVANPQVQGGGSTVAGTFGYMPPEQLMGKPGPESDLYALAAMIVYMLSGVSPADMQTLEFRLVIEPHLQSFHPAVMHLLGRMLEPSVKDRLTDYEEIRRSFEKFSHSDFDEDNLTEGHFYQSKGYIKQFESVRTLWDVGNLKLWSAFPSQTPRTVPYQIRHIEFADLSSHHSIRRGKYKKRFNASAFTRFFVLITIVPLIILMIAGFFSKSSSFYRWYMEGNWEELIGFTLLMILPSLFLLFGILWFTIFGGGKWESQTKLPVKESKKSLEGVYLKLLKYGQKSIATVVSVQYKPNSREYIENYKLKVNREYCPEKGFYIHDCPCFEISYRFNPPDDSLNSDLVHHIIVHRSVDGHLEPGDPLPILYYVNPVMPDHVYSMPFPFAQNDVENYSDVLCHTEDGRIVNC